MGPEDNFVPEEVRNAAEAQNLPKESEAQVSKEAESPYNTYERGLIDDLKSATLYPSDSYEEARTLIREALQMQAEQGHDFATESLTPWVYKAAEARNLTSADTGGFNAARRVCNESDENRRYFGK